MMRGARTRIGLGVRAPLAAALVAVACGCLNDASSERNTSPAVTLSASLTLVKAGIVVEFAAVATDAENNILRYDWDFGDGDTATGATLDTVQHAFAAASTCLVTVTVEDEEGLSAVGSVTIDVTPAGGAPTIVVDEIDVRGRIVDETVDEVVVDGTTSVQLTEGVFHVLENPVSPPRAFTFEATDQGGNAASRILSLTEN